MREIKFRAWDNSTKKMILPEFADGWKLHFNGLVDYQESWATGDLELMQYTDLKDKNGKEIYEGDITKWKHGKKWIVEWNDGKSNLGEPDDKWGEQIGFVIRSFYVNRETTYYEYEQMTSDRIYEVIGNIYENPELLK